MSLFTDGTACSLEDLRQYDSSILDVAHTENVDLTVKLGLARRTIEGELRRFLERESGSRPRLPESGPGSAECVAVTEPLRLWQIWQALALAYQDAYSGQLNDRYELKMKAYQKMAKQAARLLFDTGVGMVCTPIRKAARPIVSLVAGDCPPGIQYVAVSLIGDGGAEGEVSDAVSIETDGTNVPAIEAADVRPGVMGWNVYVGTSPDELLRQNSVPLQAGGVWLSAVIPPRYGNLMGKGQEPEYFMTRERQLKRG